MEDAEGVDVEIRVVGPGTGRMEGGILMESTVVSMIPISTNSTTKTTTPTRSGGVSSPWSAAKKYLKNHNPDGTLKRNNGGGNGGNRGNEGKRSRSVAALEAEIAELRKQKEELEEGVGRGVDSDDEGTSNANNHALDAHGGTRNRFKQWK